MCRSTRITRNNIGQAVALPLIIISLMVVLVVGLFSFEVARTAVARDQLRSATEAAALAGAAVLAGSRDPDTNTDQSQQKALFAGAAASFGLASLLPPDSDINATQQKAEFAARAIFAQNDIFGLSLNDLSASDQNMAPGKANISFQYFDPSNNAPVAAGDPRGKGMKVFATYALPTLAGNVIGLGKSPVVLHSESSGGVGPIDVVLCFDCSASLRSNTRLTSVHRAFNQATGKIDYDFQPGGFSNFSSSGGMRPQLIQVSSLSNPFNPELRGATDNSMPGNVPPGTAGNTGITDVIQNIDERGVFQGFDDGEFNFPNLAAIVEASRGNLENESVFQSSGAALALQGVVTPKAGYQQRYFELARKHTHPFVEAQAAAQNFFNLMNENAQAHFGLVAFNTTAGTDEQSFFTEENVGTAYSAGGKGNFPLPAIQLNSSAAENNLATVTTAVSSLVAADDTNTGAAIDRARQMFESGGRPNAKRAIVVFTDGVPTAPFFDAPDVSAGVSASTSNAIVAARECKDKGISIFFVGLSLQAQSKQEENRVFNMISDAAAHGGQTFQVTDVSQLDSAYAAVVRSLTNLSQ